MSKVNVKSASKMKNELLGKVRQEIIKRVEESYDNALGTFEWNGSNWDARGNGANILRDLLTRKGAGRGLPRGRNTVTMWDKAGQPHDLSSSDVEDLAVAGSDHRDWCLEIRMSLLKQAYEAQDEETLNSINWPE